MDKKIKASKVEDKRVFPRIGMDTPVAYVLTDKAQCVVGRGVAKVMNLSQGGAMIQGKEFLEAYYIKLLIAVSGENDLVMLGKITHCEESGSGTFRTGIKFLEGGTKMRRLAGTLVRSHSIQTNVNK